MSRLLSVFVKGADLSRLLQEGQATPTRTCVVAVIEAKASVAGLTDFLCHIYSLHDKHEGVKCDRALEVSSPAWSDRLEEGSLLGQHTFICCDSMKLASMCKETILAMETIVAVTDTWAANIGAQVDRLAADLPPWRPVGEKLMETPVHPMVMEVIRNPAYKDLPQAAKNLEDWGKVLKPVNGACAVEWKLLQRLKTQPPWQMPRTRL